MTAPRICICGGGNIAHALAAVFSERESVSVFTRFPERWGDRISYEVESSNTMRECRYKLNPTHDLKFVAAAECLVVCVPRFAMRDLLNTIDSAVHCGQTVFFIPGPAGMEEIVGGYLARGIDTVGFQRSPFVARIREYGHSVWVSCARSVSRLAFSRAEIAEQWIRFAESMIGGRMETLSSFLTFTFSNSNPLLHPCRLVELLKGGRNGVYDNCPFFYRDWTDASSRLYIQADREMYRAFMTYASEADVADYESVLSHYEAATPEELTTKIRGIESLRAIAAPWKRDADDLWRPDFTSRYFTEDAPYGTRVIRDYATAKHIQTPTIDFLISVVRNACENRGRRAREMEVSTL